MVQVQHDLFKEQKMSNQDLDKFKRQTGISRRSFLRRSGMAAAGGLALASGIDLFSPRPAYAQDIKGTKLSILWLEPSIDASKATRKQGMIDWATANGVDLD